MLRALCLAAFWLWVSFPGFSQADSCIWFASEEAVYQVQDGTVSQQIGVDDPHALAMGAEGCGVWVLVQRQLVQYDSNGSLIQRIDLGSLGKKVDDARQLAVDPYDESLWFSDERQLTHVSATGQLVGSWEAPGRIRELAVALDQSIWILGNKQLWHYSAQGARLASLDLRGQIKEEPKWLAVDSLGGRLWVAGEKRLVQLDPDGQVAFNVFVPGEIRALALEPRNGTAWIAAKNELAAYARDGNLIKAVDLHALGMNDPEALAYDPLGHSLWLGHKRGVSRFSLDGTLAATLSAGKEVEAISAPPFIVTPVLALIQPPPDALTNNPTPTITLSYDATCSGQPCGFGPVYYGNYSLTALLDGQSIENLFKFDDKTVQASYIPANRLPEGVNTWTAQAKDGFGHLSNKITSTFTIDTIPPKFIHISPPDGSVFSTPMVAISGNIDDPQGVVVLENLGNWNGSGANPATQNFNYQLTLKPGLNVINLVAIDKAGNETRAALHLAYNPLSLVVTSPASGAAINGGTALVTGTFQGPANTGIMVNGVAANMDGNHFYADGVPLQPGPNTITVTATTPDGLTAVQTISVTSTGASPVDVEAVPASGLAPLTVNFMIVNNTGNPVQKIEADFDGNGAIDFTATDPNAPIAFTYTAPGVYQARMAVTDSQGNVYGSTKTIVVRSFAAMDTMLRSIYAGMLDKLRVGDIDGALTAVTGSVYGKYKAVFTTLKPSLSGVVDQLGAIQSGTIGDEMAEYTIVRSTPLGPQAFLIYFIRGEDGVWRIDGM